VGEPVGLRGIAIDITRRKQAEDALVESESKYRSLVEQSLEGLVIAQGVPPQLVFVNQAISEILGYSLRH
jgi:PAS domain-containing protein